MNKPLANLEWLKAHVDYDGDDCLAWPFARARGYGQLSIGHGVVRKAHRVLCELAYGLPPTPQHEAAHSCGRGDQGCVNRKHLSWKTRTGNQRDRRVHGTSGNGGNGKRRKLTVEQVAEIRSTTDETVTSFAERFGVTRSAIRQIKLGKTWQQIHRTPQRAAVIEALVSLDRPMKASEISAKCGYPADQFLSKMARIGQVERVGRGFYRLPAKADHV